MNHERHTLRFWVLALPLMFVMVPRSSAQPMALENDSVRVELDQQTGCFTVIEKITGQVWRPDPWEQAAGILRVTGPNGNEDSWNVSQCRDIRVTMQADTCARVSFRDYPSSLGEPDIAFSLGTELCLSPKAAELDVRIHDCRLPAGYTAQSLEFPVRHFYFRTWDERGVAVFPYFQGGLVPSWLFPMRNSRFATWDDKRQSGAMGLYQWAGLSMAWFGVYSGQSAVMTCLPRDGSVSMAYIFNDNNRWRFSRTRGIESPWPRILSLSPVWNMTSLNSPRTVRYHFIPRGDYVSMAKHYRSIAITEGLFVSLKDKARTIPSVDRMRGDIYLHLYGGYPHYIDVPGMSFKYRELQDIIEDMRENLGVKKAFITAWGTWAKYPPHHWPIKTTAGSVAELKTAFNLAKQYQYLITTYTNPHAMLDHDPDYDVSLLEPRPGGGYKLFSRWGGVRKELWRDLSERALSREMEAIGPNATYTDGDKTDALLEYLLSLRRPITTERTGDEELSLHYLHRVEGLAPYDEKPSGLNFIDVPLFSLVYHDAVLTTNRWQSPDNTYDANGDYSVRILRNMIFGNEPMFVVPPYEYPAVRPFIRHAVQLTAPLHETTAFEELLTHRFLSDDFEVQNSRFADGTDVTVNLSWIDYSLPDGRTLPGRGFIIRHSDGRQQQGSFAVMLKME